MDLAFVTLFHLGKLIDLVLVRHLDLFHVMLSDFLDVLDERSYLFFQILLLQLFVVNLSLQGNLEDLFFLHLDLVIGKFFSVKLEEVLEISFDSQHLGHPLKVPLKQLVHLLLILALHSLISVKFALDLNTVLLPLLANFRSLLLLGPRVRAPEPFEDRFLLFG